MIARHPMITCDRCGSRFPAPGVFRQGNVYCCDMCANGPGKMVPYMLPRALPAAVLLVAAGILVGYILPRN